MADKDDVTIEPDAINKAMEDGTGTGPQPPIGEGAEGQAPQVHDSGYTAGKENFDGSDKPGGHDGVGDLPEEAKHPDQPRPDETSQA